MDLGICVRDVAASELADLGRFAEDHGYREVYVPDSSHGGARDGAGRWVGHDAFVGLGAMFAATTTVRGAVGVAAVIRHHPGPLALTAATLQECSGGRFSLGVGVSHRELAAALGVPFPDSPVAHMRNWLQQLRAASGGGVAFGAGWPVLLGALGPRMTTLAATDADGVVLNWMTPEHAAASVAAIKGVAAGARTVLYVRLMPDDTVRHDARSYDALANYHNHFVAQGLGDTEAIVAGTTLPLSDVGRARERLAEYGGSGLDLLCVYPHALQPAERERALAALTS